MKNRLLILMVSLALLGCTAGSSPLPPGDAGFWLGLWHGIIAWPAFIVSLFNDNVSLYEVRNNGAWYDWGFLIGLGMSVGGTATARARARR